MRHSAMFHVEHRQKRGWKGSGGGLGRSGAGLALVIGLMLAACSSPEEVLAEAGTTSAEQAGETAKPKPVAFTDNAEQDGGTRAFSYGWPAEVSAIPALAESLTAERDATLAEQKADWQASLAEFPGEDCVSCKSLDFAKDWQVVANLPRFLSLSATISLYTGGAHGNSGFEALVWDREAETAFDPKAMFLSEAALQDALGAGWCAALKAEKLKRMGADFVDDGFFPCPAIADLTLLVGSSDKRAFNRIGLIAAPYVAGSYAEGPYEVTLPVTPALLEAVKPDYRGAFALPK